METDIDEDNEKTQTSLCYEECEDRVCLLFLEPSWHLGDLAC